MAKRRPTAGRKVLKAAPREPFPLWLFLLLLMTVALFWVLPRSLGRPPVRVEFAGKGR